MLLTIRCWIVQMLMPKELRIYFQLFLSEKIKEMEQELENIAYGKAESKDRGMTEEEIKKAINVLKNSAPVFPLKKSEEYNNYVQTINQVIDWLEHEPRWIFVSERLPNHDEYIKNNGLFIVSDGNRSYSEWFDIYDKQKFGEPTMNGFRVDYAATAWMPLPEPYEPQESEEKREMDPKEEILIKIIKVNDKERSALFLQDYIQRHGPLSNEAGDIVRKLIAEKE